MRAKPWLRLRRPGGRSEQYTWLPPMPSRSSPYTFAPHMLCIPPLRILLHLAAAKSLYTSFTGKGTVHMHTVGRMPTCHLAAAVTVFRWEINMLFVVGGDGGLRAAQVGGVPPRALLRGGWLLTHFEGSSYGCCAAGKLAEAEGMCVFKATQSLYCVHALSLVCSVARPSAMPPKRTATPCCPFRFDLQYLSGQCRAKELPCCVVGVPKSIENDMLLVGVG